MLKGHDSLKFSLDLFYQHTIHYPMNSFLSGPWQSFISRYSVLHPTFVDENITQSIFSSLPAVHSETASGAKRGRSSSDEPPAEIKKPKYVCYLWLSHTAYADYDNFYL